jgi:hypothetical protein
MSDTPLYILGVDLGQAQDYTALSVLERTGRVTGNEHHYAARHLERLPTGTPYPAQVARVKELSEHLVQTTDSTPVLVVDQTGVGRPVDALLFVKRLEVPGLSLRFVV